LVLARLLYYFKLILLGNKMFKKLILILVLAIGFLALMGGRDSAKAQYCPACHEGVRVSMAIPDGWNNGNVLAYSLFVDSLFVRNTSLSESVVLSQTKSVVSLSQSYSVLLRSDTDGPRQGLSRPYRSVSFVCIA